MARLKKTTTKTAIKAAVKPAAKKRTAKRASKKAQPKTGVVLKEQGRFFLSIGDQKYDMASMVIDPAELETLAGKKVELVYSEPQSFVVGFKPPRRKPILCYMPALQNQLRDVVQISDISIRRPPVTCYIMPPVTCYIVSPDITLPEKEVEFLTPIVEAAKRDLLEQLVNEQVISQAVYKKLIRKKDILCYVPRPEMLTRVREDLRVNIADRLHEAGIISKSVYDKIK